MDPLGRSHFALRVCAAVALLAGCGGGSQLGSSPIQPDAFPTRASWMAPKAKQGDLAYVGGFYGVSAFTYPSFKYVYSIAGDDAQGLCAAKNGDWWVVESGADEVSEYAHGGTTPLKTLSVPGGEAAGCAVDPTTGTLAVTILGSGDVVVFTGGYGRGTTIADDLDSSYFDGYDDKGDLFVDGITSSDTYGVVELPKGGNSFESITLSRSLEFPGGIQWYDKYLAVGDQEAHEIYHFAIRGTNAKAIGATDLGGSSDVVQFYIQKPYVVGADAGNEDVALWDYPAGGSPVKVITGKFDLPTGVIVSVGEKR
ncbi:MAG: hypothetical protein WA304_12595 [Candidatus Cybelea sp.]